MERILIVNYFLFKHNYFLQKRYLWFFWITKRKIDYEECSKLNHIKKVYKQLIP